MLYNVNNKWKMDDIQLWSSDQTSTTLTNKAFYPEISRKDPVSHEFIPRDIYLKEHCGQSRPKGRKKWCTAPLHGARSKQNQMVATVTVSAEPSVQTRAARSLDRQEVPFVQACAPTIGSGSLKTNVQRWGV